MGMRPEEMERWGTASIFKESARLLRKHYRLFLPFFLAFYLTSSIAGVFQTVFLSPSSTPLLYASVVKGSVNTAQPTDPPGGQSFTTIFSWTLLLLISVVGTLGAGAVFYITAYLYTPTDPDDDHSIVPKVFKLLPHAFLRMFITRLWTVLAVLFLYVFSLIIVGILYAIMSAATGRSNPTLLILFVLFPFLAGDIVLAIVFALAPVIAVLEPGNYGREALKRSTKLVRIGRAGTIVAVLLTGIVLSAVLMVPTQVIMTEGMPVWVKVFLGVVIGGLDSVFSMYFGVVSVVMYFVYKARFDPTGSAGIPVFKRIDSAEHSYDPIVQGKDSVTYIGEP